MGNTAIIILCGLISSLIIFLLKLKKGKIGPTINPDVELNKNAIKKYKPRFAVFLVFLWLISFAFEFSYKELSAYNLFFIYTNIFLIFVKLYFLNYVKIFTIILAPAIIAIDIGINLPLSLHSQGISIFIQLTLIAFIIFMDRVYRYK